MKKQENNGQGKNKGFRYPHVALSEKQAAWTGRVLFLLMPLVSFTLVEYLNYNNPWTEFSPVQIGLNLVWYYLGEIFFYWVRGRRLSAVKWGLGIAWGWGMANHYLLLFRGRTLFPGDFLTLGTAANVAANYDYTPDEMQMATFVVMLACVLLVSLLPKEPRRKFSIRLFLPVTACAMVYLAVFFTSPMLERLGIEPSMWTTRGNGLALNFSVCMKYMRVEKPDGYSDQSVGALQAEYPAETDGADGTVPVNVIVVMNESLSDFSVLPGVETNQDAMPFYHSLTENTIKGYAYSSVFGGTTANSEYEFLTGNTTAYLPAGTVPYQMYVQDSDPTLVSQLKEEGYRCVAAHPYRASGWSRPTVYKYFGFDEVYFESDFQSRDYMRGNSKTGYVTDQSNYENMVRLYEEKQPGEKLFLFNVTMQNHSAYNMAWTGLEKTVWLTGSMQGQFPTVDQYLSLVYQSDRALEYLIHYFAQVEEPTMIVMFGDHQPQVATSFYNRVLGHAPNTALAQKKQMVPFLIWANYDIPEAEGVQLSLNYLSAMAVEQANLPLTGYQQFLLSIYPQVPVVNTVGTLDGDGRWYGEREALPPALQEVVGRYQNLLYCNVFDRSQRAEGFFGPTVEDETE